MSAQETTIATLQQQLHAANIQRFEKIEETLKQQDKTLQQIVVNTSGLQELKSTVEDIDKDRNKVKGAAKIAVWLGGTGLLGEAARWIFFRK